MAQIKHIEEYCIFVLLMKSFKTQCITFHAVRHSCFLLDSYVKQKMLLAMSPMVSVLGHSVMRDQAILFGDLYDIPLYSTVGTPHRDKAMLNKVC